MSLRCTGSRGFTTSTALLKVKGAKSKPEVTKVSPPIEARKPDVRLTKGLGHLSTITYTEFMKKIEKLNPELQFDKAMADATLERCLALIRPPGIMKAVKKATGSQSHQVRSQRLHRGQRELLNDWKRLSEESEKYWS